MPEYQFAEKDGSIVTVEYDKSSYFSPEQVLESLKQVFDLFPFEVEIAQEEGYDDVFHVIYKDGNFDFSDIYICAKGTTPGGRSGLKDEQRIQPKAKYLNYVFDKGTTGKKVIFLGVYSRDGQTVLCTWKVTSSAAGSPETPISKQIKITSIAKAIKEGFVQQDKGKGEYACAFKPEFLYFYLRNSDWLHTGPVTELVDHLEVEREVIEAEITPEWFNERGQEFLGLDKEAEDYLVQFRKRFSVERLQELNGVNLLNTIFLNNQNKTSLCYIMEFDSACRMIFGSIKSGTSYKYGLHYSQKNKSWATGTGRNPQLLSEDEAIDLGTQIRDYLVAGAEVLNGFVATGDLNEYKKLYDDLLDVTEGYINRVWFLKYYEMLFPEKLPPIYSSNAQNTVLSKLKIQPGDNTVYRMGQIMSFINRCDISNIVFSRVFWTYCNSDKDDDSSQHEEYEERKTCLETVREPRTNKVHPINFIVYGAPGTGKTYSMVEYALAIVDNIPIEEFRKQNTDRKATMIRYKELVKAGQIVFTTFHQNYGYEEFIQGLRPDKDSETMAFKTVDGVFKIIADRALNDIEGKNYIIIIDEINRANISKVFGELITLIEEDKRWGELNETSATLQSGDSFAVPNNLYIVGTMNSADKSISLIDAALRRRFDFIEQKPDSSLVTDSVLKTVLETINLSLVEELDSTDLLVGHSYFMNKTQSDLCNILNNNIIPLLYEYFYDNRKKVASILTEAIKKAGASVEIVDEKVGRLRVKEV